MKYVVELPLPPKECGGNYRGHSGWQSKTRKVRMYKEMCVESYRRANLPVLIPKDTPGLRVVLHLEFYLSPRYSTAGAKLKDGCYRPLDEDSARYSFKAGQDALKLLGLIPDDSARYLTAGTTRLYRKRSEHGGKAMVVATLEIVDIDCKEQP